MLEVRLQQQGAVVSCDGRAQTLKFDIDDVVREAYTLLGEATRGYSDDTFRAYSASALLFELFFNLAKVSLALRDRTVTHATLVDRLAHWQRGASLRPRLRVTAHDLLLRGLGHADRFRPPVTISSAGAPWVFLWGRPSQNRSQALLRAECEERGDQVVDLGINIRLVGKEISFSEIPAPWAEHGYEVWKLRRMSLRTATERASSLARVIATWARGWKRLELDERSIVRSLIYEVVVGDTLEHLLGQMRPQALICSMVSGLAYQAAYRANVRCVEFLHGSVQEGLTQPMVPRPRELVGASTEDLRWIEQRTHQRFVQLLPIDPTTEVARHRRARRSSERGALQVAYFATYSAGVFGGSERARADEDALVREMVAAVPHIAWRIKPHPFDRTAAERFSWVKAHSNVELLEAGSDPMEVVAEIDAAVHCGTSLSRPIGQLGIPQIEIILDENELSTDPPPLTTVIKRASDGIAVLRALKRESGPPAAPARSPLREQILLRTQGVNHG